MKNREIINAIDNLSILKNRQVEKGEKLFSGKALLIISRNLRALWKEYSENYLEDLKELREKYYVTKETEVTVPADEENGVEEHKETRSVEVLKPELKEEDWNKELQELLDVDVKVPILYLSFDDLDSLTSYADAEAIDFMVK